MIDKEEGIVRYTFQNINGISIREGVQLMMERATIGALQIDVAALSETSVMHWNKGSRDTMSQQLYTHLENSRIVCASNVTKSNDDKYQPGGQMLVLVGPQCGRMK